MNTIPEHSSSRGKKRKSGYAGLLCAAILLLITGAARGQQALFHFSPQLNPLAHFRVATASESHPFFVDIDGDGDLDCFAGEYPNRGDQFSRVYFYRNEGSVTHPLFKAVSGAANPLSEVVTNTLSIPYFIDIDADGDYDCFIGEGTTGALLFYLNTGTPTHPFFEKQSAAFNPLSMVALSSSGAAANPAFADLDGDGDYDCVVADGSPTLRYYRNAGTPAHPRFEHVSNQGSDNPFAAVARSAAAAGGGIYSLSFEDWDHDGLPDLFIAGGVYYHNEGSRQRAQFRPAGQQQDTAPLLQQQQQEDGTAAATHRYTPLRWVDLNGDGTPEVMQGTAQGGFSYQTLTGAVPKGVQPNTIAVWVAPNPSGSSFTIHLPTTAEGAGTATTVRILDVQGKVLTSQTTTATTLRTGAALHPGIYLLQILQHNTLLYQQKLVKE